MIIDFHNHFFPTPYLDALRHWHYRAGIAQQNDGQTVMVLNGDYNVIVQEHHDPIARLQAMDAAEVDMQVLTMTVPGVHSEKPQDGIKLAQLVNDGFAAVIEAHPTRYAALAALPLQDPAAAVHELERAVTTLGLRGGTLFTHINGTPLDDISLRPLFEKATELDVPLFIHPTIPNEIGLMGDYRIVAVTGFLYETTTAICRLVYSGLLEALPDLKLAVAHMGGTIPFVAERIDRGYDVYPECRVNLSERPSHYLRKLYMDTFPDTPNAIRFATEFVGAKRVLMGTDYPHQIGDLPGGVQTIKSMSIAETVKEQILGQNAATLLGLKHL